MPDTFNLPGRVLRLTLSGKPFEVMLAGEKLDEYRRDSQYIRSRVVDKDYDYVVFYHGPYTGGDLSWFAREYKGYDVATESEHVSFSNGLEVEVVPGMYVLHTGALVASGNLKAPTPAPSF